MILVNTARALKFLESYAARQTKLWKVLSKYHNLPDHFHNLKTTLQAEFDLLKKATSKNIQEAVQSQQAYTTVLSGHINTLYTKLVHLDRQVQIHCLYPHPQSDVIQLNIPDYDPDIEGDLDPATDVQPPNAEPAKEEISTDTSKPEDHTTVPLITNRPEHQPSEVSADTDRTEYDSIEQPRVEHASDYHPQLEDIPELETDEENWDDGQFDDAELLYNHNSTEESNRIYCEYSAYFEKVEDQEYSPYHTAQGINTTSPNQIITMPIHNQNSTRNSKTKMYTHPHLPLLKTCIHGTVEDEEEPGISSSTTTDCMVKKLGHWKAD